MLKKRSHLTLSLIAILLSFVVASIVMLISGISPLAFFLSLIRTMTGMNLKAIGKEGFFNARYLGEFIQMAMPIILTGLSVGFAFRTGLFNIGAEGQVIMGSVGAVSVGILFNLPFFLHIPLAISVAALCGAFWGWVPGYFKARFGVHEVVITIMMNYTALYLGNFIMKALPGSDNQKTVKLAASSLLHSKFLRQITGNSRLHWGFIVVIIALFVYHFIIEKTIFGYELRAVGFNKDAAEYGGIKVPSRIAYSMAIAGAFAGLAGAMLSLGTFDYGRVIGSFENYGFDGIAVALLGGNTAFGIFFGGLLFGGLKSSQTLMQASGIPLEIAIIVSALIILFVAMKKGVDLVLERLDARKRRKNESH